MATNKTTHPSLDLVLATNHRFFIRYTIMTALRITIATAITYTIIFLLTLVMGASTATKKVNQSTGDLWVIFLLITTLVTYIIYFIVQIVRVFAINHKITEMEKLNIPKEYLVHND